VRRNIFFKLVDTCSRVRLSECLASSVVHERRVADPHLQSWEHLRVPGFLETGGNYTLTRECFFILFVSYS